MSGTTVRFVLCRALFWILALAAVLVIAGCGRVQNAGSAEADGYQVTFATGPSTPVVGESTVTVRLQDKAGRAMDAARIFLEANMSHAGMVPVTAEITSGANGVYTATLKWTMGGVWYVDATITLPGGEVIRCRFPIDVK